MRHSRGDVTGLPVVEGYNLGVLLNELRVERALDTLAYHARPAPTRKVLHLIVYSLELALADLKHEGPVRARLWLAVW